MTHSRAARITRRAFIGASALSLWAAKSARGTRLTLRVTATPSIFKQMFERLARGFEKKYPGIAIELAVTARDQNDQLQSTLRRALVRALPDVSFEGLNHLRTLHRHGIAVPLEHLIREDAEWDESIYAPSLTAVTTVERVVAGLGAAVSVPIVYYNADLIAGALGRVPVPRQWDAVLSLLARIRQAVPGVLPGFLQHAGSNWMFMALVESLGGRMMQPDEMTIAFDEAPGRRALEIYRDFGLAGQARADMGRDQARQAFVGGAIGLLVDSSSSLTALAQQIGGRFRLGTIPIPRVESGRVPAAGVATVLMTRDPVRQRAAWKFMKFVAGPEGQTLVGKTTGYLPANTAVMRERSLLGDYYDSRPLARPAVETLPYTSRWYAFPGNNAGKIEDIMIDSVSSVVALRKTPDEALATMKRRVGLWLP